MWIKSPVVYIKPTMRSLILLILAVVACQAAPVLKTPEEVRAFCTMLALSDRGTTQFFVDPFDCRSFYMCTFDLTDRNILLLHASRHFKCQGHGLHFDQELQSCVHDNPNVEDVCERDVCKNPAVAAVGYYVPDLKPSCRSFFQCAHRLSVHRCCPEGQVFDVIDKQCVVSDTCSDACVNGNVQPEEETDDGTEYEEGKTYTCYQGDYKFEAINSQQFVRTHNSHAETFTCPEERPVFNHKLCTCVAGKQCNRDDFVYTKISEDSYFRMPADGSPAIQVITTCSIDTPVFRLDLCQCDTAPGEPDRTLPDGVTLGENQCYLDQFIYTKSGDMYFKAPADGSPSIQVMTDCPPDRAFFRLESCQCDVMTIADFLEDNQCVLGLNMYEKVDDRSYKIAPVDNRASLSQAFSCPDTTPLWNQEKCYCDFDLEAPAVSPEFVSSCKQFSMTDGKFSDSPMWVDLQGVTLDEDQACFTGFVDSRVHIPFYSGNDFGDKLTVGLSYRHDELVFDHEMTSLVGNGVGVDVSASDLEVNVTVTLTSGQRCSVAIDSFVIATETNLNSLLVTFDGVKDTENLILAVNGEIETANCQGAIMRTSNPMTVGAGFVGCIDDLYICKEIPEMTF